MLGIDSLLMWYIRFLLRSELLQLCKVLVISEKLLQNVTAPSAAAPEFEDRNEQDEGGKGEEVLT